MAEKKALLLRIPPDLWESLTRWAQADLRSLNAQIEFLLREAVKKRADPQNRSPGAPDGDRPPEDEAGSQFSER